VVVTSGFVVVVVVSPGSVPVVLVVGLRVVLVLLVAFLVVVVVLVVALRVVVVLVVDVRVVVVVLVVGLRVVVVVVVVVRIRVVDVVVSPGRVVVLVVLGFTPLHTSWQAWSAIVASATQVGSPPQVAPAATHSFWHLEVQLPWLLLEPLAAARRGNVIAASPVASIAARFILEVVAIGAVGSSKSGAAQQGRNGSGPPHAPATARQS